MEKWIYFLSSKYSCTLANPAIFEGNAGKAPFRIRLRQLYSNEKEKNTFLSLFSFFFFFLYFHFLFFKGMHTTYDELLVHHSF